MTPLLPSAKPTGSSPRENKQVRIFLFSAEGGFFLLGDREGIFGGVFLCVVSDRRCLAQGLRGVDRRFSWFLRSEM